MAERSTEVRELLKFHVKNTNINTLDLAELLYEAQENGYPGKWGYESLPKYAAKELKIKERKARYLAHLVRVCRAVGLLRSQYEPAGISKLREITTLDPDGSFWNAPAKVSEPLDDHIVRLILDADTMTVQQIRDEVARLKGQVGPDRRVVRSYSVAYSTWENVIKVAYEKARRLLGSKGRDAEGNAVEYSDGVCQEVICANFLAQPEEIDLPLETEKPELKTQLPMEKK
jgi:hypothetical protein